MNWETQKSPSNRQKIFSDEARKEEMRNRLERLKEAIDAEKLLESLGFEISRSNSAEVRAACKVHGGDNKSAFRMNKLTKNWICFSHNCHETVGFDVISLVKQMLNISFMDAVKYLESISGVDIHDESAYVEFKRDKDRREFIAQRGDNRQVPSALLSEEYLKSFKKFRSDFFEKPENGEFPKEVLNFFEVGGGYVDRYSFQRDVIPIRDREGILRAYSCRDITGKASYDYKYLLTKGFDKDKVLYNLCNAKSISDTIIVVEGFKSVWKLHMAGYFNAVACMGSRITTGQQNLLYTNAYKVVLLLDGDEAGMLGTIKAVEDMRGKIEIRPIFFPYDDKDPADIPLDELHQIIGGL
jgi:DNA primase